MAESRSLDFPPPYKDVNVTFDNRSSKVRIHRRTLRLMGDPRFVRIHYSRSRHQIIIERIDPKDGEFSHPMNEIFEISQRVYDKSRSFELTGQPFFDILRSFTLWKAYANYRVQGQCSVPAQHVILNLDKYEIILKGKALKIVDGH